MYEYRDREESSQSLSDTGDDLSDSEISDSESDSDEEQGAVASSGASAVKQEASKGSATSLKSSDIEKEYQKKPKNCPKFTAGQTQYEINFTEMRQINLASGHKRRVVRRPKITALQVKTGNTSFTSSSQKQHVSPRGTKPIWQFEGDSGKWYEFKYRPCKFYNRGNCKDGSHCRYLHVCEYYFKGNCKHGIKCKYSHSEDGDDFESQSQEPRDKPYQWQIRSGSKWYDVEMDWIIEAQYSLPNVKGIKLYNTKFGMICINFNAMRVQGKQLGVRRQTFPNSSQKTAWLWYFRGDTKWQILGKQSCSVQSKDIEDEYQRNPNGKMKFTIGSTFLELDFSVSPGAHILATRFLKGAWRLRPPIKNVLPELSLDVVLEAPTKAPFEPIHSTELKYLFMKTAFLLAITSVSELQALSMHSFCMRNCDNGNGIVVHEPCFPPQAFHLNQRIFLDFDKMEIQGGQMTPYRQTSLSQDETEEYLWYFFENRHWHEYGSQGSSKTKASVTSRDIEQQYQINQQGSCTFTVGNMAYSLNFSAMTQSNPRTGMQRRVRRRPKYNSVIQKTNSLASLLQDLSLSSTMPPAGGFTWQFRGDEGVWREYKAINANGVACSVSSDDIEQSYQQNPQGQLQFTAGHFSYTLDFSGMSQFNSSNRTKRDVRRIPSENQQKSSSLQGMALSSATPPAGSYVWQFRGEEGVWTEYKTNNVCGVVCSITSDDIEQSYQQNPQGQLQFTAGQFSYMLDCSGKNNFRSS
ncbi:UNVERIFIED_CONTAM: hypothetical protein FKN15_046117 [Acipenser sinensis]